LSNWSLSALEKRRLKGHVGSSPTSSALVSIKFITLNLWKGGEMWESILRFLQAEKPDILVTQETYNGVGKQWAPRLQSVELIKNALEFPDVVFAGTRKEQHGGARLENGNAIFSRYPIVANDSRFFDVPYDEHYVEKHGDYTQLPRAMQLATLDYNGTPLHVGNVHGIWGFDGNDSPRRIAMAETIVAEITGKASLILAGDFNMQEGTESISKIEAVAPSVFKGKLQSTFNMRRKSNPGYATAIVDMVFATPDAKIISATMPDVDISDHMPLVVEVAI